MKYFIYTLLLFSSGCSNKQKNGPLVIDPTWQKRTISDVLSVSLPDSITFNKTGALNASFAEGRSGLYGIDYYDTVVVDITSELYFRQAIKGYMQGKLASPQLLSYDLLIRDTIIANTSGLFVSGYSADSLQPCKYPFCFLTMANSKFYWFYACQSKPGINNETRQFYHAIQFAVDKIKESAYTLLPEGIHKTEANFR